MRATLLDDITCYYITSKKNQCPQTLKLHYNNSHQRLGHHRRCPELAQKIRGDVHKQTQHVRCCGPV